MQITLFNRLIREAESRLNMRNVRIVEGSHILKPGVARRWASKPVVLEGRSAQTTQFGDQPQTTSIRQPGRR